MHELLTPLYTLVDRYLYWFNMPDINKTDIIEIIILAILIYYFLVWVKDSRAWSLLKGIIVVLLFVFVAAIFQMSAILWLAGKLFNIGIIALVVIFQPELRRALEQLGRSNFLASIFRMGQKEDKKEIIQTNKVISEIVKASFEMSKYKTGALIVVQRETPLTEFVRTGITLDAMITSQLLINIFEHNTPLHDGAVVVNGNRVVAATCYLPLSDNFGISKELGTRHRAAVGVSEVSDSVTVVVSEETGAVSIAMSGKIFRNLNQESLTKHLTSALLENDSATKMKKRIARRFSNVTEDR